MIRAALMLAAISLTGCASARLACESHPMACGLAAGSLVLCAGGALRHHEHDAPAHIPTPGVVCTGDVCR